MLTNPLWLLVLTDFYGKLVGTGSIVGQKLPMAYFKRCEDYFPNSFKSRKF